MTEQRYSWELKYTVSTVVTEALVTLESFCLSFPWSDNRFGVIFAMAVLGILLMESSKGIASFFRLVYSISSLTWFF